MMGNCKVERAKLSPGFIPMGMKEYGGIIYVASYNPDTKDCEIGSFPSPERDITGSTKIGHQTGLQDGHFKTSDYSVPKAREDEDFTPDLLTSKIQKLNEESVLMLNPGDKFITTYKINAATGSAGQEVITDANFSDFFSSSNLDKKLFSINFYKIDSGNNIVKIPNNEINTIRYRTDIEEDEYEYYTQSSSGSIAVGIEANTLSYFSSYARESSKLKDFNKSIIIEAVGESDSMMNFKGIRVDLTKNDSESTSFHIENQGTSDKVSVKVEDFIENDEVKCDVTPYSDYGYISNLMESFNIKLGQSISGQNVNNIFKWRVDTNNRLELDFDFLLETENNFKMYLEFYDPWSNVSMVRDVSSPSMFGPMRLVIDLQNEPTTDIFDPYVEESATSALQRGGISFSKLSVSNNQIAVPILINPDRNDGKLLVRNDRALRKNHFYIVRLCGYEEYFEDGELKRIFHDAYRALYTNEAFNSLYEEQATIDRDSINYKPIFCETPYPLDQLKYTMTDASLVAQMTYTKLETTPLPNESVLPRTIQNDKTYLYSVENAPTGAELNINTKWRAEQNYSINLVKPTGLLYGDLKPNLLTVKTTNQTIDLPASAIQDEAPQSSFVRMNSEARVVIPDLNVAGTSRYNLKLIIDTNRPITGKYVKIPVTSKLAMKTLDTLHYFPESAGFTVSNCTKLASSYINASHFFCRTDTRGSNGAPCRGYNGRGLRLYFTPYNKVPYNWPDNHPMDTVIGNVAQNGRDTTEKLFPRSSETGTNFPDKHIYSVCMGGYIDGGGIEEEMVLLMVDANESMFAFKMPRKRDDSLITMQETREILKKFYYYEYTNTPSTRYYISNDLLYYSTTDQTKLTDATINVVSGWNDVTNKTYLTEARFQAVSDTHVNFDTSLINQLIDAAKARAVDHEIVANAENISDANKFIPYIDADSNLEDTVSQFKFSNTAISIGPDTEIYNMMNESADAFNAHIVPELDLSAKNIQTTSKLAHHLQFCEMIKHDPSTNRLTFDRSKIPSQVDAYGIDYSGRETSIRVVTTSSTYQFKE